LAEYCILIRHVTDKFQQIAVLVNYEITAIMVKGKEERMCIATPA
jgi:hypothetical protein